MNKCETLSIEDPLKHIRKCVTDAYWSNYYISRDIYTNRKKN